MKCKRCSGKGTICITTNDGSKCPDCDGTGAEGHSGKYCSNYCSSCGGTGIYGTITKEVECPECKNKTT